MWGKLFVVHYCSDSGFTEGPKFRAIEDALRHIDSQPPGHSYAIRQPDGSWYRDPAGRSILLSGQRRPRRVGVGSQSQQALTGLEPTARVRRDTPPLGSHPRPRGSEEFDVRHTTSGRIVLKLRQRPGGDTDQGWPPGIALQPASKDTTG